MKYFEGNLRYRNLDGVLKKQFGKKVFKVSLNAGFTCPNKDGTKGLGGCIFCSPKGSGDFAGDVQVPLIKQFQSVKAMLHQKWPDAFYIAYLQANTNTYASLEALEKLFNEVLSLDENIIGICVATRCDALDEAKIQLLASLKEKTFVQVELGLQSIHETTAQWMNRGHDLDCVSQVIKALRVHQIDTVVHIINGFPYETKEMMLSTVHWLNQQDIQGIKIHMLHVMEQTALATLYKNQPFKLLDLEEYVDITTAQLEILSPNIVIHRLTGDSPKELLIAPKWILKKFVVLNEIEKLMRSKNTYQGIYYQKKMV